MIKEIHPQWVLVNGQLHRVTDFSHLPQGSRPDALCPLCMNHVILKLGSERVHHYAHQPEITCAATHPETALHLNTKFYIYEQLLSGNRLYLEQQCSNDCGRKRNVIWLEGWERRVEIEAAIGSFRPDITIIDDEWTINAIEVMVTHSAEDAKEMFYKENNINWLEIKASESIYEGENTWTLDKPLPFLVCQPHLTTWICNNCVKELREENKRRLREEYRKHNYSVTHAAKLVDFYFKTGKKLREVYFLHKIIRNDKPAGIEISNERYFVILRENGVFTEEAIMDLANTAVKGEIANKCNTGAIVDEREWTQWISGKKFVARDTIKNPFRYKWDNSVTKWVKPEIKLIKLEEQGSGNWRENGLQI